jgi:AraC family transcriptional regulator
MKLSVKNMVCDRCVLVVRQLLEELQLEVKDVKIGEAEVARVLSETELAYVREAFQKVGFELIEDKKQKLSEKVKTLLIQRVNELEMRTDTNLSDYISGEIGLDYYYLSHVFSSVEATTIEKFFIYQKVEKIKELLRYGELTVSEIAWKLGYSSVQALSNQFKKVTGMTPSAYKQTQQP